MRDFPQATHVLFSAQLNAQLILTNNLFMLCPPFMFIMEDPFICLQRYLRNLRLGFVY